MRPQLACAVAIVAWMSLGPSSAGAQSKEKKPALPEAGGMSKKEASKQEKMSTLTGVLRGSGVVASYLRTNDRFITIVATDSSLQIPESTTEGLQTFTLQERGKKENRGHRAVLVARIPRGTSFEDASSALASGRLEGTGVKAIGGPGVPDSTGKSVVKIELRPGRYVIGVAALGRDGRATMSARNFGELRVLGISRFTVPPPQLVHATVRLVDNGISLSRNLNSGGNSLRIDNASAHEKGLVIRRLEPGATRDEAVRWMASHKGPAPFSYLTSVMPMSPQKTTYGLATLDPGDYLFGCDVPASTIHSECGQTLVRVK